MTENTILLAEDSEDDEILLKLVLRKAGLVNPVHVVRDGEEVIAHLKNAGSASDGEFRNLPKILFLDLRMPKIGGLDVLRWMKSQPHLKGLLVVVLSHYGEVGHVQKAYDLGAHSFLSKPFLLQDLNNLMKHFKGYWICEGPVLHDMPKYQIVSAAISN
ncbi:MAG: response regulator [Pedosphaera sp.]|nr:response regulator [Pedosphaera sp.]